MGKDENIPRKTERTREKARALKNAGKTTVVSSDDEGEGSGNRSEDYKNSSGDSETSPDHNKPNAEGVKRKEQKR